MRKLTKIVAPALVALLAMGSLAPTIAEAAPHHQNERAHHRAKHQVRHAPPRHVAHRKSHHRVVHRKPARHHHAPVHHDRRHH
jgi:Ni/Co efflux regulator RcnB